MYQSPIPIGLGLVTPASFNASLQVSLTSFPLLSTSDPLKNASALIVEGSSISFVIFSTACSSIACSSSLVSITGFSDSSFSSSGSSIENSNS